MLEWIDSLPEVGGRVGDERAALSCDAATIHALERRALALRAALLQRAEALEQRVSTLWTPDEIAAAKLRANDADACARRHCIEAVPDAGLREALASLDGHQTAAEVLVMFHTAGVVGQCNLLSTASDDERRAMAARVLSWWNWAARPVFERLLG